MFSLSVCNLITDSAVTRGRRRREVTHSHRTKLQLVTESGGSGGAAVAVAAATANSRCDTGLIELISHDLSHHHPPTHRRPHSAPGGGRRAVAGPLILEPDGRRGGNTSGTAHSMNTDPRRATVTDATPLCPGPVGRRYCQRRREIPGCHSSMCNHAARDSQGDTRNALAIALTMLWMTVYPENQMFLLFS